MTELQATVFCGALLTAVGVAVTYLVGKNTDRALHTFVERIAQPMQEAVNQMYGVVNQLPTEIHSLGELVENLADPLQDVARHLDRISKRLER